CIKLCVENVVFAVSWPKLQALRYSLAPCLRY
ncbi:hypothetical protein D039_2640, partial [Vibrio parahaemolyticus EKP-028]